MNAAETLRSFLPAGAPVDETSFLAASAVCEAPVIVSEGKTSPRFRDYQEEGLSAVDLAVKSGCRKPLVAQATGTGKTVLFSNLPRLGFTRILVVAHREELLDQAAEKLRHWNPGLRVDVDQAERVAALAHNLFDEPDAFAVCASVQTIGRKGSNRLTRYPKDYFDAIVIDEAHHATAASYRSLIEHFHAGEPGGPLLFGTTATPFRADGSDLSKVFERVVYALELPEAIQRGILVDVRAVSTATSTSLEAVGATREDFKAGELEDAINTKERNGQIVKTYLELGAGRKCMVFASGVAHSKDLTEAFCAAGVAAEHVDGTTDKVEIRPAIRARFKSGETRVLVNMGVFTEGFDEPSIGMIILARPTKSGILYMQCLGRGTRTWCPNGHEQYPTPCTCPDRKDHLLVVDVFDIAGQHADKLVSAASIFGLPPKLDLHGESAMKARKKVKELEQLGLSLDEISTARSFADLEKLEVRYREINLFWSPKPTPVVAGISRLTWISQGDNVISLRAGDFHAWIRTDLLGRAKLVLTQRKDVPEAPGAKSSVMVLGDEYANLEDAIHAAELKLNAEAPRAFIDPNARWRKDAASEKQIATLKKYRVPFAPGLTKGEAGILLDKLFSKLGRR